ncbi:MAG: glycosyltransferase family 61 protein [Jatrophihabitantaceae bacterium]
MRHALVGLLWRLAVRAEPQLRSLRELVARFLAAFSQVLRALPGTSWRFGPPRRLTFDTYGWASGHAAPCREVDAPWISGRSLPEAAGQILPHQFTDSLAWPMPRTFVLTLDDARLWGRDAITVTADDTVLADQANAFHLRPEQLAITRRLWLGSPRRVPGVSATIGGAYAGSYYHWMFDLLPRLDVLRRSGLEFDHLVTPDSLAYQRETLAVAGVRAEDRISYTADSFLHTERLLVPSLPGTPGQSPPIVCQFLRDIFAAQLTGERQGRRLYLSRADTFRRLLANEAAVIAALAALGFESVTMAGRSVAEQARLFAQAEVVVAPHGGALTNLVFCQPGTKVVELFPPGYTPVCFWTIALAAGLVYRPVFDDRSPPHARVSQWVPYEIEPSRVLDTLAELGVETPVVNRS